MRHLLMFVAFICCAVGCASNGNKSAWDEVWKDLNGDNMKMRGFGKEME